MTGDELQRLYDAGERDFRGADLSGVDLSGVDLTGAILIEADLRGATLADADLRYASLRGADLTGASLDDAQLSGARGIIYASATWAGHGECGRQLLAIAGQDDGVTIYHCGCFRGTRDELIGYIEQGEERYRRSRSLALQVVDGLLADCELES